VWTYSGLETMSIGAQANKVGLNLCN